MTTAASHAMRSLFVLLIAPATLLAQNGQNARVDSIFAQFANKDAPGCAVGAIRDGTLVHARGYGAANLDYGVPIDTRSVFYLASVSKQVTAFAVALAAQEGKLALDDDVRKFIPELPDYGTPFTVRHLVHHTSGVRDYLTLIPLSGRRADDSWTDAALLGLITRQKALNFPPGSEFLYSNTGYVLLAEVVRRATGQSLAQYADARIFKPLGMRDTHFHDDAGVVVPRRVIGYGRAPDGSWRLNHWFSFDKVGDGGLYSTVEDLAKWDANFYSGQVGGTALQQQVVQRGVLMKGDTIPYAFGLMLNTYRGLRTVTHGGSLAGFRTGVMRFPDQRFSVIVLCNSPTANVVQLAGAVAQVYLGDRMTPESSAPGSNILMPGASQLIPVRASDARDFVGSYRSEELDAVYEFVVPDSLLVLRRGAQSLPVRRSSGDVLNAANATMHFTRDSSGRVTGFSLDAGRVRGITFQRVR